MAICDCLSKRLIKNGGILDEMWPCFAYRGVPNCNGMTLDHSISLGLTEQESITVTGCTTTCQATISPLLLFCLYITQERCNLAMNDNFCGMDGRMRSFHTHFDIAGVQLEKGRF